MMATYHHNVNEQRDVMPANHKDPVLPPYTESSLQGKVLYLNRSSSTMYSDILPGNSEIQHNLVELSVPAGMLSQEPSIGDSDLVVSRIEDGYFNAWRNGRNEMEQPVSVPETTADDVAISPLSNCPRMGLKTQLSIMDGQKLSQHSLGVSNVQTRGLSLSLSAQIPMPTFHYHPVSYDYFFVPSHQSATENCVRARDRDIHVESSSSSLPKLACPVINSKYLKAAKQLLDEFVNVQKALKQKADKSHLLCGTTKVSDRESDCDEVHQNPQESTGYSSQDLSSCERQNLQNKMTKLLAMLDEVDRRYKQYYHQIQIVISSFDVVAGHGAAKPYTALALQTISQHFRSLRDAIDSQIRATSKSLGEDDLSPVSSKGSGISRLRYIDQEVRQQRNFRQFGIMQPHAWRPQRGLPENSISLLRAWLFEHFLHPYPKDSEKLMLARQTGLTRNQVSNWFINARVRLWKPMIEEMYKDEFGNCEVDHLENAPKRKMNSSPVDEDDSPNMESTSEKSHFDEFGNSPRSGPINDLQMDVAVSGFQREINTSQTGYTDLRVGEHKAPMEDGNLLQDVLVRQDESGRHMAHQMAELGKYRHGGVSLTLGLQHCHGGLPISEGHQRLIADIYKPAPVAADMSEYDCLNLADRQHRFSNSSQMLHDFVA